MFPNVPIVDKWSGKRICQVCEFIVNTDAFSPVTLDGTIKINKDPLNCKES